MCSQHAGPCAAGWWEFDDTMCDACTAEGPDCHNGEGCWQQGNGLCYRRCAGDADCPDPCYPHCVPVGLNDGQGYLNCDPGPKVCVTGDSLGC